MSDFQLPARAARCAALPEATNGAPVLASFALLRTAMLPFAALEALRMPQTDAIISAVLQAESDLELVRDTVEDALHRTIPRIDLADKQLRRRVLALRRNVHNGRPLQPEECGLEEVRPYLGSEDEVSALAFWIGAQARLKSAQRDLKTVFAEEMQSVLRPALRAPLRQTHFRQSLALSNAAVLRQLDAEQALPTTPWPSNLERTLLGYLTRAAAKTSPFASFMGLSVIAATLNTTEALPHADRPVAAYDRGLNRGIVARLDDASRLHAFRGGALVARVNPTLERLAGGRHVGLCNRETVLIGRPWFEQRWAQFRFDERISDCLVPGLADRWEGWTRRLAQAGAPDDKIAATLEKLLERGLLLVEPLTDAFDAQPITRLIARWREATASVLPGLVPTLQQISKAAAGVADGRSPTEAGAAILAEEGRLLAALGRIAPEPLQNPLLETCWLTGIGGIAGRSLLEPLHDLADFLGRQMVVSPLYARMRRAFVTQYGTGGTCDDPVMFLLRAATQLIDVPEFGASVEEPDATRAPPGVSLPVTAFVQVGAPGSGGGSRPRMAVNRVFDGAGWLAARFTAGDSEPARQLAGGLADWLRVVGNGREPVDVVLAGHCSDLQAHRPLTERVLHWPGEHIKSPPDRVIEAADLVLSHDPSTDLIEVHDRAGIALSLAYLGNTFPSPIWGVRYALSILTQPYLLGRPSPGPRGSWEADAIRFEPRIVHGEVVVQRAAWWVSTRYARQHWFTGGPADWLLQARRDFERHDIPAQLFAQRFIPSSGARLIPKDVLDAGRKPIWIDVRNPFCLGLLERIACNGEWVSLTEAFPAADALWLELASQKHVSELHVEMMVTAIADTSLQHPNREND